MKEDDRYRLVRCVNGRFAVRWNGVTDYNFMPKADNRDNKNSFNAKSGYGGSTSVRIPSLKRSNSTWKKFYELFPYLKGETSYRGVKLKKI